ncbi:hypothetical protein [Flavobacterium commune]|uniref:Uncharacterized protein n=1 Tax=Flavobacterium commune TaxID=1306519 RepID=A0A1D9PAM9_9FLAO|nr:hypothetical protein [Flavobacterium commune]AOZ99597.1 hypothetical protein BIW12_09170 [Flavobacterium commune]
MPQTNITVTAKTEIELLTRKNAVEKVNELTTDQLKRVLKLIESPKAKEYLSSDLKFAVLQKFL